LNNADQIPGMAVIKLPKSLLLNAILTYDSSSGWFKI